MNLAKDGTWNGDEIVDGYDKSKNKDNVLTFKSKLYGSGQDSLDKEGYYAMWYQVVLEENVEHFFLPGWFAPMNAVVQSTLS